MEAGESIDLVSQRPEHHRVRFWLVFARVHLRALWQDRWRTALAVVGIAIGVTVVVANVVLKSEFDQPFAAFGPSLTAAARGDVLEIDPHVQDHLPEGLLDEVKATKHVKTAVPVVNQLTPIYGPRKGVGVFLIGTTCDIENFVGSFDCKRNAEEAPAAGPGIPLSVPKRVADAAHVAEGDELELPGLPKGTAHVGWVFTEESKLQKVNNGSVIFAPDVATAQALFGTEGYLSTIFTLSDGPDLARSLGSVVGDVAHVGPPVGQIPPALATTNAGLGLMAIGGIVLGVLIAVNTTLLAVEERRGVMGTVGALGASGGRIMSGFAGEGALLGLLGGVVAIPGGFYLGKLLVGQFGEALLSGSGASLTTTWSWEYLIVAVAAGLLSGLISVLIPASAIVRQGPLAMLSGRGGAKRGLGIPWWPAPVGVVVVVFALYLLSLFSKGRFGIQVGSVGQFLALIGAAGIAIVAAPLLGRPLARLIRVVKAPHGTLVMADLERYTMLFAGTATTLAIGASMAIGYTSVQNLGVSTSEAFMRDRMDNAVLLSAQELLSQREGWISDPVLASATAAATSGGQDVEPGEKYRSILPSDKSPRIVVGVEPGSWLARALVDMHGDADAAWRDMSAGQIALSVIASGRLHAKGGDTLELPTAQGRQRFKVADIFTVKFPDDSSVGDWILASPEVAQQAWGAVRQEVAFRYDSEKAAAGRIDAIAGAGPHLYSYDVATWEDTAGAAATRYMQPFSFTGWIIMIAAGASVLNIFVLGLVQRRRERAVLHAVGMTTAVERSMLIMQSAMLGIVAALLSVAVAQLVSYSVTLSSPLYFGFQVQFGLAPVPILIGAAAVILIALIGVVYPVIHAGDLAVVETLREE